MCNRWMGTRVLVMLRSPRMTTPSVRVACKWTSESVAGRDLAANGQHFARKAHGLGEVVFQMRESCKKEVAEIVSAQPVAAGKAVIEKLGEKLLVLGEGHQAVANVAGRKYAEITPQPAGASALVSDRDHGSEARDLRPKLGGALGFRDVVLETAQNR